MKNYDLERKIYRYKTITKYQEKAKMLGYQDTSKVVFSFLNKIVVVNSVLCDIGNNRILSFTSI